MKKFLMKQVLRPMADRVGTLTAGMLTTYSVVDPSLVGPAEAIAGSIVLFGMDLLIRQVPGWK